LKRLFVHGTYFVDVAAGREDTLLDPARDNARIRAFFVHPAWPRRGICSQGYTPIEQIEVPLDNSLTLPEIRMSKTANPTH